MRMYAFSMFSSVCEIYIFTETDVEPKKVEYKTKEKERLELYLLSTNNVETHYSKFFLSDLYK